MFNIKKFIFGTNTKKKLKQYKNLLQKINSFSDTYKDLSHDDCLKSIIEIRAKVSEGQPVDDFLPEVFNLVRIAALRTIEQYHFDVQILGGLALHDGQIAEMKTGEGKTLTSTLPVVLNALSGKGVHVVTVNDYLAKRDSEWMGEIYNYLGLSVGLIQQGLNDAQRKEAYSKDITYGTNNEFGFDYLRDNMKFSPESMVQRGHHYAIIDEVDSILIDEARTPLIISGPSEGTVEQYSKMNQAVFGLTRAFRIADNPPSERVAKEQNIDPSKVAEFYVDKKENEVVLSGDYTLDEKTRNIQLTEEGAKKLEARLINELRTESLYDSENIDVLHHINQALKARYVFKKDVDYVIKDERVIIVDEFTGRLLDGRRYSDGLHQALEAKEGVIVGSENQTLATITYQNYFRRYNKLAGMTGTAETEEGEFNKIYRLGVVVIPTNRPLIRRDQPDAIYKTARAKNKAIGAKVLELYKKNQPVLVGTDSIENSEEISALLQKKGIKHNVLNAKYFEKEAEIIANAGIEGAVTIATNMAGRGTDIKLTEKSKELGGLYILGTVRHESRRVDNQLRGRSGRQGDPGESKFFISLEDSLLRVFGGERISRLMTTLKYDEDEPIEHALISRAIENAQKNVESRHFAVRKHLLEYDDVMNRQREIIYAKRTNIMLGEMSEGILEMSLECLDRYLNSFCPEGDEGQWDLGGLKASTISHFGIEQMPEIGNINRREIFKVLEEAITASYNEKRKDLTEVYDAVERQIMLDVLDVAWKEHLLNLDYLREAVSLSGYAQKNPLDEYKKEAFYKFSNLITSIEEKSTKHFFKIQVRPSSPSPIAERKFDEAKLAYNTSQSLNATSTGAKKRPIIKKSEPGRNDPCFCGSGKKYKNCCMLEKNVPLS